MKDQVNINSFRYSLSRTIILTALVSALSSDLASAQQVDPRGQSDTHAPYFAPGDIRITYLRLLQLTGDATISPLTIQPVVSEIAREVYTNGRWAGRFLPTTVGKELGKLRWGLLPLNFVSVFNSDFPEGQNDGVLWAGRGLSSRLDFGLYGSVGPVTLQVAPSLYFSQNRDFPTVPVEEEGFSSLIYPWYPGKIDMPQRFGDKAISGYDWGQSYFAFKYAGLRLSYGTQNQWWGPARYNPIIMSSNGPGLPHLSLGNVSPLRFIGQWQAEMIWGKLLESEWFDSNPDNDKRFLTGLVFTWQPRFIPNLAVGASRVFYKYYPSDGLGFKDYFIFFESIFKKSKATPDNPGGEDEADQMVSVFGRWVFPDSGLEVYAEWARNDHNWDLRDFLQEPDHSRAYTVGMQKAFLGYRADYYLGVEITQIGKSMTVMARATPTYYQHHKVLQGYTNKGQVIGAGIGPGSECQRIELTRMAESGLARLSFSRIRWDNDAYFSQIAPLQTYHAHDVSYICSAEVAVFIREITLIPEISYTWRLNRNFIVDQDSHNLRLNLSAAIFFD